MSYCYKMTVSGTELKKAMNQLAPILSKKLILKYLIVYKKGEEHSYLFCNRKVEATKGWWAANATPARIYTIDWLKEEKDQFILYGDKKLLQ